MKEKIIEKQDEIIANLKEVGQLYFRIKDKATKQDVARMASLTIKGRTLESELIILKAQDISVEPLINQEVEKRIKERQLSNNEIKSSALKLGHEWLMISGEIIAFIRGAEWYRSFMTQKTEG